ncbi:Mu transposase domain-containing protein, partial [Streptobacillus canis]|uniref:Mu transposase domain-containing protein n=1 Tax=Streptobacillus canis TaxID=2678686 RepID=UPI0038B69BF3
KINDEENIRFHQSYQKIPVKHLEKEKAFLQPLPCESIRKQYKVKTHNLKVDNSSLITYHKKKYSVPPKYIGKIINVQQIDDMLYMYCSTKLITFHQISKNNTCIIGENNGKNSL